MSYYPGKSSGGGLLFPGEEACRIASRAALCPGEEDFGIVPVEAQAAGLPVIAYSVGGAVESVLDGQTGVLFDHQDLASLTAAIERFCLLYQSDAADE